MNTYQKGNRREVQAMDILRSTGWLCDRKNRTKFQSNDFYNMFDIIAIRGSEVRFIQVKSNKAHWYKARKDIQKWMKDNNIQLRCEVWLKENHKDWVVDVFKFDIPPKSPT